MTFDPFGDFETHGYLRNIAGEKDSAIVKRLEHTSFTTGIDDAFAFLQTKFEVGYSDLLKVHGILFDAVYPWAGQDRTETAPDLAIRRGPVLFARPADIRRSVEFALKMGNEPEVMAARPGDVMGYLAYGHPFLDGNGRALMVVHTVLAERAGISIDWASMDKTAYLQALTAELDEPGKTHLDRYLSPYVGRAIGSRELAGHLARISGLDGSLQSPSNEIAGSLQDPALRAQYEQQELKYEKAQATELDRERDHDRGSRGR